jgi:3-oxoacyl-[acyl-carrier-protein] synthase-3
MSKTTVIAGVGRYLPERVVTSHEVECMVAGGNGSRMPPGLIERVTGIRSRRYGRDDEQASDLAVAAARDAIGRSGIDPQLIDTLIFAACSQDIIEPATANIVQDKLGLVGCNAFDVKNACNSVLTAVDLVDSGIRSGKIGTALVCAGEKLNHGIAFDFSSPDELSLGFAGLTLGDAGGALVLTGCDDPRRGIRDVHFKSYGNHWDLATVMSGGTLHRMEPAHAFFRSRSAELKRVGLELTPAVVTECLAKTGWPVSDIELVCSHQVTLDGIEKLHRHFDVPLDKNVLSLIDHGNTAAASIPLSLSLALDAGRLRTGMKVLLVGVAAGFSVGVITLEW